MLSARLEAPTGDQALKFFDAMLSGAIEGVSPSNVKSIRAELAESNRARYLELRESGCSASEAAAGSWLGRSANGFGFWKIEVIDESRFLFRFAREWLVLGDSQIVRELIKKGRGADLYRIVMGLSEFNRDAELDEKMSDEEQKLWHTAMTHLEFVSRFGTDSRSAEENGTKYYAFPEEFEKWIDKSAPGIFDDEISAYLNVYPI